MWMKITTSYQLLSSSDPHPLTFYLTYIQAVYLAFYLRFYLTCFLAFYQAFYLTFLSDTYSEIFIRDSIWHSMWRLALAIEVPHFPLRSGFRSWGLAVPTELWSWRLRAGSEGGGRGRGGQHAALIQSRDPNLVGGGKHTLHIFTSHYFGMSHLSILHLNCPERPVLAPSSHSLGRSWPLVHWDCLCLCELTNVYVKPTYIKKWKLRSLNYYRTYILYRTVSSWIDSGPVFCSWLFCFLIQQLRSHGTIETITQARWVSRFLVSKQQLK